MKRLSIIQSSIILSLFITQISADTYSSKGCYSLSSLQSVLSSKGEYTYETNSYCESQCSGNAVAATLNGGACYCGDKLPSDVDSVSSDKCDVKCQGFPSEICGGDGYLSVYTNGEEDTDPISDTTSSSTKASSSTSSTQTSTSASTSASSSQATTTSSASSTSSSSSSTSSTKASSSSTSPSSSTTPSSSSKSPSSTSSSGSSTRTSSSDVSTSAEPSTYIITSIISASNQVHTITQVATPTSSSISSASASASATSTESKSSKSGLSKGAIAGIAIGSVVGVALLVALIVFIFIRTRDSDDEDDEGDNGSSSSNGMEKIHNENPFYDETLYSAPVPYYSSNNGHKRLSNGSLPDARVEKSNTLRVTNPDDSIANDTTLHETQDLSDEIDTDESDWRHKR